MTTQGVITQTIAALSLTLGALQATAGEIVIDGFDTRPNDGTAHTVEVEAGGVTLAGRGKQILNNVLGDWRRLELEIDNGVPGSRASATVNPPPPSTLSAGLAIRNTGGIRSITTVLWNGFGLGLNDPAIDAGDITDRGSNDRLLVGLLDPFVGTMLLSFELVDAALNRSSIQVDVPAELPESYAGGPVELPFADFTVGAGFDWMSLFSIAMVITSEDDAFRTTISYVKAVGPRAVPAPATLPILVLGMIGIILAGRQSKPRDILL